MRGMRKLRRRPKKRWFSFLASLSKHSCSFTTACEKGGCNYNFFCMNWVRSALLGDAERICLWAARTEISVADLVFRRLKTVPTNLYRNFDVLRNYQHHNIERLCKKRTTVTLNENIYISKNLQCCIVTRSLSWICGKWMRCLTAVDWLHFQQPPC